MYMTKCFVCLFCFICFCFCFTNLSLQANRIWSSDWPEWISSLLVHVNIYLECVQRKEQLILLVQLCLFRSQDTFPVNEHSTKPPLMGKSLTQHYLLLKFLRMLQARPLLFILTMLLLQIHKQSTSSPFQLKDRSCITWILGTVRNRRHALNQKVQAAYLWSTCCYGALWKTDTNRVRVTFHAVKITVYLWMGGQGEKK